MGCGVSSAASTITVGAHGPPTTVPLPVWNVGEEGAGMSGWMGDGMSDDSVGNEQAISVSRDDFRKTITRAVRHLHARQQERADPLDAGEVEDLVILSRELENLQAKMRSTSSTVLGTWRLLEQQNVVDSLAQRMYNSMLASIPRMQSFFDGVESTEQPKLLGRMLATAVHVYGKPDVMLQMFHSVGARHRVYGVTSEHFEHMREAFFHEFPQFIGQDVFEACQEEWRKFWSTILEAVERGSKGSRGEEYAKIYQQETVKKLQSDFGLIRKRQEGLEGPRQFVGTMYGKAIEMDSRLASFEPLKDLRSSRRVFQSLVDILEGLNDMNKVEQYMLELGGRHVAYNVTAEHMKSFSKPFLYACHHFLENEWNMAMEARFVWVWELMLRVLSEGMEGNSGSVMNMRAPKSSEPFCLVFTDIEGSTRLWGKNADVMAAAVKNHHRIVRSIIAFYGAYEVKTVGDSFMIACQDIFVGIQIALSIQLELMRVVPITPGFEMLETTEGGGDPSCWRSEALRVRAAVQHCVDATATYDTVHQRHDYYGPSVNCCARIQAVGCGGQILMSKESLDALTAMPAFHDEPCPLDLRNVEIGSNEDEQGLDQFIAMQDIGAVRLKDIPDSVHLISITPKCLEGRTFVMKAKSAGLDDN